MDKSQLILMLIALATPLIVWGVRWAFPFIPKLMLPALATALGPLLDWAQSFATGTSHHWVEQLAAGGAAVALREIVDQAKKAARETVP